MGKDKFKNLFLILVIALIIIGVPYLLYSLGTLIEIDYFGYINNWWVVLLFILLLIASFILGSMSLEKNMASFFLILFTVPLFILGIRFGTPPGLDMESYGLLIDKEREIDQVDSVLSSLENDLMQLEITGAGMPFSQNGDFKNHEIIFFEPGSTQLSDYNKNRITAFVTRFDKAKLNISGYSDDSGNEAFNLDVSKERAQQVADFILSLNHQNNTVNGVTGFGDNHQLVENRNEMARSKNRRVTIEIVGSTTERKQKEILEAITQNRDELQKLKLERESLRKLVYRGVEE